MKKLFHHAREARRVLRREGFRSLLKLYGWKLVAVIFVYYLIRDVTIYLIIPALLIKSF